MNDRPRNSSSIGLCLAVVAGLYCWPLRAEVTAPTPYDPQNHAWNGLSELTALAKQAKVNLRLSLDLDWSSVEPGQVIVLLYPLSRPEESNLTKFLRDGGHVILADDFGRSDRVLSQLDLHRRDHQPQHGEYYLDKRGLPVVRPLKDHFLFWRVDRIVTNHPGCWKQSSKWQSLVEFDDGASGVFVAERSLGLGKILVISDASLFINLMLRFQGNAQFVANVLRYYCFDETCEVQLLLPGFGQRGHYVPRNVEATESLHEFFQRSIVILNQGLKGIGPEVTSESAIWFWSALMVVILLWMISRFGRWARPLTRLAFQSEPVPIRSEFDLRAQLLVSNQKQADFTEPLSILLAEIESVVAPLMPEKSEFSPSELADRFFAASDTERSTLDRHAVVEVLEFVRRLAEERLQHLTKTRISHKDFNRIYNTGSRMLHLLESDTQRLGTRRAPMRPGL